LPAYDTSEAAARKRVLTSFALMAIVLTAVLLSYLSARSRTDGRVQSVAVLPFKAAPDAERQEALEAALVNALVTKMSRIRGVTVVSGNAPKVDAVLDGTMSRGGDTLFVSARLVRVADSSQLWQTSFQTPAADTTLAAETISARIVDDLYRTTQSPAPSR
jgi:TolB-like protein